MARILIVDDEPNVLRVLRLVLLDAGYVADCVTTGEAAIEFVQRQPIDCAVLDYKLPGIDGHQALATLLRHDRDIGAIVITAYGKIPLAVEALRLGAFEYLTKPFDNNHLLVAVARVLERRMWHGTREVDLIQQLHDRLRTAAHDGQDFIVVLRAYLRVLAMPNVTVPLFASCARSFAFILKADDELDRGLAHHALSDLESVIGLECSHWPSLVVSATARLENRGFGSNRPLECLLSRELGVSPAHLGRLIKNYTMLSVPEWKWISAVRNAFPLILHTSEHVGQIALQVGYKHVEVLTRDFEALFSATPTAFRSRLRNLREKGSLNEWGA